MKNLMYYSILSAGLFWGTLTSASAQDLPQGEALQKYLEVKQLETMLNDLPDNTFRVVCNSCDNNFSKKIAIEATKKMAIRTQKPENFYVHVWDFENGKASSFHVIGESATYIEVPYVIQYVFNEFNKPHMAGTDFQQVEGGSYRQPKPKVISNDIGRKEQPFIGCGALTTHSCQ